MVAALFVKVGVQQMMANASEEYIRVATSVPLPDGRRAVGSVMGSPALKSIKAGHPYHGEVPVHGAQYITDYEPIKDASGETIGAYSLDTRSDPVRLKAGVSSAQWSLVMLRNLAFVVGCAVIQVLCTTASVWAADFGTADEARAMLEKAVAAVKADKTKALDMFNKGEGGFKDRDLYVFCANASDGILTAHPTMKGKQLREILGKKGYPLGQEMMQKATEGTIREVTYWWPRPGSDKPLEKTSFYTKVGDQMCGVGYYK